VDRGGARRLDRKWTRNELWVYDSVSAARAVVPSAQQQDFRVFAYRLLPSLFDKGRETSFALPPVAPEPLSAGFGSPGFDVVSRSAGTSFECSPLSCNYMAKEIDTNEFCLLPTVVSQADVHGHFESSFDSRPFADRSPSVTHDLLLHPFIL
jgi:hypothetical protein